MFLGTINSAGLNENRRIAAISQKNLVTSQANAPLPGLINVASR